MSRRKEIAVLSQILTDPENSSRTDEEVADLLIEALDKERAASRRLAVVGQIQYRPQEPTHTVVLGPFSAPLALTDHERFTRAVERPCRAAREAGEHLAWDYKTKTGAGRFMLAPAFMKPRDAWDFWRGEGPAEGVAEVIEAIPTEILPACCCGLPPRPCPRCGQTTGHYCHRHGAGEQHRCGAA